MYCGTATVLCRTLNVMWYCCTAVLQAIKELCDKCRLPPAQYQEGRCSDGGTTVTVTIQEVDGTGGVVWCVDVWVCGELVCAS